jgi:hypothetical protein
VTDFSARILPLGANRAARAASKLRTAAWLASLGGVL